MNLPAPAVIRPSYAARSLASAEVRQRWQLRRVSITWYLLVLNAATFYKGLSGFPIPGSVGKIVTQGALPLALVFALSVNRKLLVRPNLFLCLVGLLVLDTILTIMEPQHFGTLYRTVRFVEFYAVLWLLTPWWGRRDLFLLRCHLRAYYVLLGSAAIGHLPVPGEVPRGRQAHRRDLAHSAAAGRPLLGDSHRTRLDAVARRRDAGPEGPAHRRGFPDPPDPHPHQDCLAGDGGWSNHRRPQFDPAKPRVRRFFACGGAWSGSRCSPRPASWSPGWPGVRERQSLRTSPAGPRCGVRC